MKDVVCQITHFRKYGRKIDSCVFSNEEANNTTYSLHYVGTRVAGYQPTQQSTSTHSSSLLLRLCHKIQALLFDCSNDLTFRQKKTMEGFHCILHIRPCVWLAKDVGNGTMLCRLGLARPGPAAEKVKKHWIFITTSLTTRRPKRINGRKY